MLIGSEKPLWREFNKLLYCICKSVLIIYISNRHTNPSLHQCIYECFIYP